MRAIAKLDARPFPPVPDLPTLDAATGINLGDLTVWNGLVAPRGTPPAIIDKLAAETAKVINEPAFKAKAEAVGHLSGQQHARRVRRFHPRAKRRAGRRS